MFATELTSHIELALGRGEGTPRGEGAPRSEGAPLGGLVCTNGAAEEAVPRRGVAPGAGAGLAELHGIAVWQDGSALGATDGAADSAVDGIALGAADGAGDGATDDAVDGSADGIDKGVAVCVADGAADGPADGAADGVGGDGGGDGGRRKLVQVTAAARSRRRAPGARGKNCSGALRLPPGFIDTI